MSIIRDTLLCFDVNQQSFPFLYKSLARGYNILAISAQANTVKELFQEELAHEIEQQLYPTLEQKVVIAGAVDSYIECLSPADVIKFEKDHVLADQLLITFVEHSTEDLNFIISICKSFKVRGILPTPVFEKLNILGKLNDKLGLPGLTQEMAENFIDKVKSHSLQSKYGCNTPQIFPIPNAVLVRNFALKNIVQKAETIFTYPVVIRPRICTNKQSYFVVHNEKELLSILNQLHSEIVNKDKKVNTDTNDFVIEEYIDHEIEYEVSVFVKDGKVLAYPFKEISCNHQTQKFEVNYNGEVPNDWILGLIYQEIKKNGLALSLDNCIGVCDIVITNDDDPQNAKAYIIDIDSHHTNDLLMSLLTVADLSLLDLWFYYILENNQITDAELHEIQTEFKRLHLNNIFNNYYKQAVKGNNKDKVVSQLAEDSDQNSEDSGDSKSCPALALRLTSLTNKINRKTPNFSRPYKQHENTKSSLNILNLEPKL